VLAHESRQAQPWLIFDVRQKMKLSLPKILFHIEGLAVVIAACAFYAERGSSWSIFAALLLAPDLAMLGYLFGARVGAISYNLGHSYAVVGAFWLLAHFSHIPHVTPLSLIWLAHIGIDRFLGYGLKYPTGFKDTHLGRL
jgi:hypothetical protein